MESQNGEIKVRIAPSPTGDWHLGNARTALFNWLFARNKRGKFYLRVEDTDRARYVEGSIERLLHLLTWLGMEPDSLPDGEVYLTQSHNVPRYREIAEQLVQAGKAYYCFATSEELEAMRAEQQAAHRPPHYDNRWEYRDLAFEEAEAKIVEGQSYVIRQKMPQEGKTTFHDIIHGEIEVENRLLDDHVLLKADGFPTYHLAHVVDDHDMGITHVIRGDEWLSSAPRHVQLYRALEWHIPQLAHLPVILGTDKGKLSKRHGAKPVFTYEEDGYLPEGLLNYLALLGWASGSDQEFYTPNELVQVFSLEKVHSSPAIFDPERLNWFNAQHIRKLTVSDLRDRLLAYWDKREPKWADRYKKDSEKFDAIISELQDRLITLKEFSELADFFYEAPHDYLPSLLSAKGQSPEETLQALQASYDFLSSSSDWSREALETGLRQLAESRSLKAGAILWPIRVALTGLPASPGSFEVLALLGKDESLNRLTHALTVLKSA
jgi:glutamyl-tRNA synthetase